MKRAAILTVAVLLLLPAGASCGGEASPAVEVAPQAEKTRQQLHASAAWCEGAKTWLVAWREGFLNEPEAGTNIWCARVSADGKALDPAGVALTSGKGLKDQPRVASDGKSWLVVWQDFRSGKDWDVYGARVSGDGKALDKDGFVVAGGEHNQCRPDAVFAKGNYLVAWQGFKNGYGAYTARVSPEGKPLDAAGVEMAVPNKGYQEQVFTPALGTDGESVVAAFVPMGIQYGRTSLASAGVDAASGRPAGGAADLGLSKRAQSETNCPPAVAVCKDGGMVVLSTKWDVLLCAAPVTRAGAGAGAVVDLVPRTYANFVPTYALVHDGKGYLLVSDFAAGNPKAHDVKPHIQVRGWRIAADGKVEGDAAGFEIAADAGKDQLQPSAAAGPAGKVLVVYSETRGADNVKVLARVVK